MYISRNVKPKSAGCCPAKRSAAATAVSRTACADSARRLLALKSDPDLQKRVDDMASRHTEGRLTAEEQAEYGRYVSYATFMAILKSKARQLFAASNGA